MNYKKYIFFIGLLVSSCAVGMERLPLPEDNLFQSENFPPLCAQILFEEEALQPLFEQCEHSTSESLSFVDQIAFDEWTNQKPQDQLVMPCTRIASPLESTAHSSKTSKEIKKIPIKKKGKKVKNCSSQIIAMKTFSNTRRKGASAKRESVTCIAKTKIISKKDEGQSKYYCPALGCQTYSLWEHSIMAHLDTHTDAERAFICGVLNCHAAYKTEQDLLDHSKSTHKKFPCNKEGCPKSFASIKQRANHEARLH